LLLDSPAAGGPRASFHSDFSLTRLNAFNYNAHRFEYKDNRPEIQIDVNVVQTDRGFFAWQLNQAEF